MLSQERNGESQVSDFFDNNQRLQKAMGAAVRKAVRTHKLLGQPIVVWREGKVVWVPPEEIEVDAAENGER